jgi:hypothetical protein
MSGAISLVREQLLAHGVDLTMRGQLLEARKGGKSIEFYLTGLDFEVSGVSGKLMLPVDVLIRHPHKTAAMFLAKMASNNKVFARNCVVQKVPGPASRDFLDSYHVMGGTTSASSYGLFRDGELLAIASFSKGRKMRRLREDQRSFELIRFCTRPGYTVTGGLSRLVKIFCQEKKAAEVMTYVDRQYSDGRSFVSAGFRKMEETAPRHFLVDRGDFGRTAWDGLAFDEKKHYLTRDAGNIKMIFTCP